MWSELKLFELLFQIKTKRTAVRWCGPSAPSVEMFVVGPPTTRLAHGDYPGANTLSKSRMGNGTNDRQLPEISVQSKAPKGDGLKAGGEAIIVGSSDSSRILAE